MKQHQQLKCLLGQAAGRPSSNFTGQVMDRIMAPEKSTKTLPPLVSARVVRIYLVVSAGVISAILILCLVISFNIDRLGQWMLEIEWKDISPFRTLLYLTIFWVIYGINALILNRRKGARHSKR